MSEFTKGHTPGPWRAEWLDDENGWIMDSDGKYLAEIVASDSEGRCASDEEQVSNAELMAAAPDLLSVLQDFILDVEAVGIDKLVVTDEYDLDNIDWPDLAITYRKAVKVVNAAKGMMRDEE